LQDSHLYFDVNKRKKTDFSKLGR